MIINLTQHLATPEQIRDGVRDLPPEQRAALIDALTVSTPPTVEEIASRANRIAQLAVHNGLGGDDNCDPHPTHAMLGCANWMVLALEMALAAQSVYACYSFTERVSVDVMKPDGTVQKTSQFKHIKMLVLD